MALAQVPCPFCKQPVYIFQPGCFSCRQGIQWPAAQTQEHMAAQQAAVAWFNQAMTAMTAAQQPQAQASAGAPAAAAAHASSPNHAVVSQAAAAGMETGLGAMMEATHHAAVTYDPNLAEDVDGLLPSSFKEFVPVALPIQPLPEFEATAAQQTGGGLGVTPLTEADGLQPTLLPPVAEVPSAPMEGFDPGDYGGVTASVQVPVGSEMMLETTRVADAPPPRPARKATAQTDTRQCADCGTRSNKAQCPSCGARTREIH